MRVITYDDAVDAARRRFLASSAVDMNELARDLAVSRATLYRVVTSHDRLLGDVLWGMAGPALERAIEASRDQHGVDRIVAISSRFEGDIAGFRPLQRWLQEDPLAASRVLFTPAGAVHERCVAAWGRIFADAVRTGELVLPCGPEEFAYLYVRLGESLMYGGLLAGVIPDPRAADSIRRAIFHAA